MKFHLHQEHKQRPCADTHFWHSHDRATVLQRLAHETGSNNSIVFDRIGLLSWLPISKSDSQRLCQRASCATCRRDPCALLHERLSADSARSRTMQRHWDDLKSIAQQQLTLSTFHTVRSLIRLVFVTSHLVCYSTMTSLDL